MYNTVQYCTVLYNRVLYSTALYNRVLYSTAQYCTALRSTVQLPKVRYPTLLCKVIGADHPWVGRRVRGVTELQPAVFDREGEIASVVGEILTWLPDGRPRRPQTRAGPDAAVMVAQDMPQEQPPEPHDGSVVAARPWYAYASGRGLAGSQDTLATHM